MALSPLNARRWQTFKSFKRSYVSLVLLSLIFFITLFAEVLCNQRPLIAYYKDTLYFPILKAYPETTFGGVFDTEADYLDPTVAQVFTEPGHWAIFPPIRFDYEYVDTRLAVPAPSPPDQNHLLGTDDRARDVLSRLIYGFRLSFLFGLTLALFGSLLGVLIGAVQGYLGGIFDMICQRFTEIWSSQNELYLLIILSSIFNPSVMLIFVLLSLFGWMGLAAYVRAEFLRARQYEYVQSAVALGMKPMRVIWRHVLPNTLTPVITFFPFRVSTGIMGLTALDFLSLGVPPPTASLGELLSQGKSNLTSWWIITSVFIVITALITALNFIGEGMQKALSPKG